MPTIINTKKTPTKEKPNYNSENSFDILNITNIQNKSLLHYLEATRKINISIAVKYLKEIHFKPKDQLKTFYCLGFPSGQGYEARSSFFK